MLDLESPEFPVSPDEFKDWLEQHEDERVVGRARFGSSCPLATYIKRGTETFLFPCVTPNAVLLFRDADKNDKVKAWVAPDWVQDFVEHVDTHELGAAITARRARELLEEVTHQEVTNQY